MNNFPPFHRQVSSVITIMNAIHSRVATIYIWPLSYFEDNSDDSKNPPRNTPRTWGGDCIDIEYHHAYNKIAKHLKDWYSAYISTLFFIRVPKILRGGFTVRGLSDEFIHLISDIAQKRAYLLGTIPRIQITPGSITLHVGSKSTMGHYYPSSTYL